MIRHLHGFNIEFEGPAGILEAIAERLRYLPEAIDGAADLRFEYVMVDEVSSHLSLRPKGSGRSFYNPVSGEATYWADQDCCYLSLDHRARALCLPAAGRCIISLQEPEVDTQWIASHPLFTIPFLEMLKRRGTFFVHAATLALNDRCVLLPGTSGSGKSTLSAALLRSGFDYMGDDIAFLKGREEIRMLAFPEPISLSGSAAAFFPDLSDRLAMPLATGYPKHEIELPLLAFDPTSPSICWDAKPAALIFPAVSHVDKSVLEPMSSDEALSLLAANLLLTEQKTTQAHLDALAALARDVPANRLHTGRDFDRVAEMCRGLLG